MDFTCTSHVLLDVRPHICTEIMCITQTSYLQDSSWSGIVSIILIEKNVFKDKAVNKSVGRGQLLMIINIFLKHVLQGNNTWHGFYMYKSCIAWC
jgi:hypothetical protein